MKGAGMLGVGGAMGAANAANDGYHGSPGTVTLAGAFGHRRLDLHVHQPGRLPVLIEAELDGIHDAVKERAVQIVHHLLVIHIGLGIRGGAESCRRERHRDSRGTPGGSGCRLREVRRCPGAARRSHDLVARA
jgi:hypothetical protein